MTAQFEVSRPSMSVGWLPRINGLALAIWLAGFAPSASAQQAIDALAACYRSATLKAAAESCEPPEIILQGTYVACSGQEAVFHSALRQAGGPLGARMAEDMFVTIKAKAHTTLLAMVVKMRGEKGLCR